MSDKAEYRGGDCGSWVSEEYPGSELDESRERVDMDELSDDMERDDIIELRRVRSFLWGGRLCKKIIHFSS